VTLAGLAKTKDGGSFALCLSCSGNTRYTGTKGRSGKKLWRGHSRCPLAACAHGRPGAVGTAATTATSRRQAKHEKERILPSAPMSTPCAVGIFLRAPAVVDWQMAGLRCISVLQDSNDDRGGPRESTILQHWYVLPVGHRKHPVGWAQVSSVLLCLNKIYIINFKS
jgi:hypothetical protein